MIFLNKVKESLKCKERKVQRNNLNKVKLTNLTFPILAL